MAQWVGWEYGEPRKNGKHEKIPINPRTGRRAKTDDPKTWGTFEEAIRQVGELGLDGIGFVFTENDPFIGIDFDDCRDPISGNVQAWALKAIEAFGSYSEVSPSGTGVKVIVRGELPGRGRKTAHVEMYDRGRFFTVTGDVFGAQKPIEDRQDLVEKLYSKISSNDSQREMPTPQAPREAVPVNIGDRELLEKARNAGNGPKFRKLYDQGDVSSYGSESEADFALSSMLAFWTGRDPERMERLFSASALRQREKWAGRPDYRRSTVEKATSGCTRVYEGKLLHSSSTEVRRVLAELHREALADPWTGRSGPSERWIYSALINTGGVYGKLCDEGVIVSAASRDLSLACGRKRQAVERSLERLEERGRVYRIEKGHGQSASAYLLPRWGHKESKRRPARTTITTHPVFFYGPTSAAVLAEALAKVGNPAPQIDKAYDKNGRKIVQESKHLLRPMGDSAALLVEKVAAHPGMDLSGLSEALERPPSKVQRILDRGVEGGFVFEVAGRYYAPEDLLERLETHLKWAGCNYREDSRRRKYKEERENHAERYEEDRGKKHRKRLEEMARVCGVEEEPEEEEVIQSVSEVAELARSILNPEGVLYDSPPPRPAPPGRDPLVHRGTEKAEFYRAARERWAAACAAYKEKGELLERDPSESPRTPGDVSEALREYLGENPEARTELAGVGGRSRR